ncbi:FtsK/SpoIIIE domain-containing protein [Gordonia sp. YY1]|uniref:FtsK/SpoIIIE domain-containing protein n=1 Tax=Gordonia sp. YY1 TaxID=396712 RepID=UPI0013316572|nr:FtsK/SpoIIIE domain-containing protein [Gordonia sp. YY1]KAF0967251.1 hypothetical protein BPODLACK_04221 [Gordonia sp. YY1]
MADIDELLGLMAEPAPERKAKPAPKREKETRRADTAAAETVAGEGKLSAKASQTQILNSEAAELVELARRVSAASEPPAPETSVTSAPAEPEDSPERVARLWNQRFADESWRRQMFGCNAPAHAEPHGPGVRIFAETDPSLKPEDAIKTFQREALAIGAGQYGGTVLAGRGPHGGHLIGVWRKRVGADPATPWNAAGHAAGAFYADDKFARHRILASAGLDYVVNGQRTVPTVVSIDSNGPTGPEFTLRMLKAQPFSEFEAAVPKLTAIFRTAVTVHEVGTSQVLVRLNTEKKITWPTAITLRPPMLWRPTSPESALKVARKVFLPVGLTADGETVTIDLATRPMGLVAGSPGSGKSRWVRTAITAFAIEVAGAPQGGILIGDAKGGELITANLPGVRNVSTSVTAISRMLWWARQEMKKRQALIPLLSQRGVTDPPFAPVWCIVDEWGSMLSELLNSTDTADQNAGKELVRLVSKIYMEGRSVKVYMTLVMQSALAASLPGSISQSAGWRLIAGKPKTGSGGSGHIERLFQPDQQDEARAVAAGIVEGQPGFALMDHQGKPTLVRTFHGYTPGEEPTDPKFAGLPAETLASWRETKAALEKVPSTRRFGWAPPEGLENWQDLSLYAGKDGTEPTVRELRAVPLDDENGNPIPAHFKYDPLHPEFDSGGEVLDLDSHFN